MPHDLTGSDGQRHVAELAVPGQPGHLEQRRHVGRHARSAIREDVLDGPPGHPADEVVRARRPGRQVDRGGAPVLEHGHPVPDLADLLQAVRDVDDSDIAGGQLADDAEQVGHLVVGENGAWLIHHDQPGFVGQCPGHADHLLGGGREAAHDPRHRDVAVAQPIQHCLRLGAHLRPAHEAAGRLLVAEEDVLGHGEVVHQIELLVDRRYPGFRRGLWAGEGDLLALPQHRPRIRAVHTGQHLDQRRLAGTVLSEQAVNLTRPHLELHAVERAYAREGLHNASEAEHDGPLVGIGHELRVPNRHRERPTACEGWAPRLAMSAPPSIVAMTFWLATATSERGC